MQIWGVSISEQDICIQTKKETVRIPRPLFCSDTETPAYNGYRAAHAKGPYIDDFTSLRWGQGFSDDGQNISKYGYHITLSCL